MRIVFDGGPWDGCTFDVPVTPSQLVLRRLHFGANGPLNKGQLDLGVEDEFYVYSSRGPRIRLGVDLVLGVNLSREPEEGEDIVDLVDEDSLEEVFKLTPNAKSWLDSI